MAQLISYDEVLQTDSAIDASGIDNPRLWLWEKSDRVDVYFPAEKITDPIKVRAVSYITDVLEYAKGNYGEGIINTINAENIAQYMQEYNTAYENFVDKFLSLRDDEKEYITNALAKNVLHKLHHLQERKELGKKLAQTLE